MKNGLLLIKKQMKKKGECQHRSETRCKRISQKFNFFICFGSF